MAVIAESLLAEVVQQPMTWCDPDDASAALGGKFCRVPAHHQNALGPTPAGETRATFDNAADYAGQVDDITDAAGNNALVGYRGEVAMAWAGSRWSGRRQCSAAYHRHRVPPLAPGSLRRAGCPVSFDRLSPALCAAQLIFRPFLHPSTVALRWSR